MNLITALLTLVSVMTPSRTWYPPTGPVTVDVKAQGDAKLVLADFDGKIIAPSAATDFNGQKSVDLKQLWPAIGTAHMFFTCKPRISRWRSSRARHW